MQAGVTRAGACTACLVLVSAVGMSACGGNSAISASSDASPAKAASSLPTPGSGSGRLNSASVRGSAGTPAVRTTALKAVSLHGALEVRKVPSAAAATVVRLPPATPLGSTRVLLVDQVIPGWVRVELPVRPNGSSGWVAASAVRIDTVHDLISVDLSARRMTVVLGGQQEASTSVGVGSVTNPTPIGRFFVTDRVRPTDPQGPYGAFVLGLSAHSPTLSEFGSGDGQVAIHGTDAPSSIGRAASHGCIRVPGDITGILARVPLGTPVIIR
jgi:lipoprotein-anchoring transpeptidase ErfK/SrfK